MQLSEAVELWLLYKRGEGLSPRTIRWYRDLVAQFVDWLPPERAVVGVVKPVDIALWLSEEAMRMSRRRGHSDRHMAPASIEARYRALAAFFSWCEASDELGNPPSPIGHGRKKAVKRPRRGLPALRYVRYEEYQAVAAAIDLASWVDYRDYCLVGVLFWAGLRLSELAALNVGDVDLAHGQVLVRTGKGGKARLVPLDADVVSGLVAYLNVRPAGYDALWLAMDASRRGIAGRLRPEGIRQVLRRRCRAAGVGWLHPHAWRHGFAMAMLNAGAELSSISAMMGHSDERVTSGVYAHWLTEGLRREYAEAAARIRGRAN